MEKGYNIDLDLGRRLLASMYSLVSLSQSIDIDDLRQAHQLTCIHVQMELFKGYTSQHEVMTEKTEDSGSQLYMHTAS